MGRTAIEGDDKSTMAMKERKRWLRSNVTAISEQKWRHSGMKTEASTMAAVTVPMNPALDYMAEEKEEAEFVEADVLWPEIDHLGSGGDDGWEKSVEPARPFACRRPASRPVSIPAPQVAPPCHRRRAPRVESVECGVPPHVMLQRRAAEFSVRAKGRRLCEVRDAVLRLTGFIER